MDKLRLVGNYMMVVSPENTVIACSNGQIMFCHKNTVDFTVSLTLSLTLMLIHMIFENAFLVSQ